MSLVLFILASYGLTSILVYGRIFDKIRPNYYFFKCPQCMGFWVGMIVYWLLDVSQNGLFHTQWNKTIIETLLAGFVSSGTSYMLSMLISDEGLNIKFNSKDSEK